MVEFKRYGEKTARRLGGDMRLLNAILEGFAGRRGVLREESMTLRAAFQDGEKWRASKVC
jgi:hypothetical protein